MEIRRSAGFLILISFTLLGFFARLLPHPPNMVPITALAVFAGARIKSRWGVFLPVFTMLASDFFIGFYDPRLMFAVYGSFIAIGLFGFLARPGFSPVKILGATLLGSVFFYLTTNFAVWTFSSWYPKTLYGLLLSYTLALPFFRNSLAGDIFYAAVFFGAYELVRRRFAVGSAAKQPQLYGSRFIDLCLKK